MLAQLLAVLLATPMTEHAATPVAAANNVPTELSDEDEPQSVESVIGRLRGVTRVRGDVDVNAQPLPNAPVERLSWKSVSYRKFITTQVDAGYIYLKPRLSLGYGTPFFRWVGIDLNPLFTNNYIAGWGGLRFALPVVDLRVGARYVYSLRRNYLDPQSSYDRTAIELSDDGNATMITYEAELTTGFSTRFGEFGALGSASRIGNVPSGKYVYEEILRVVAEPTFIWRARGQFAFYAVPGYRQFTIGPALDFIAVPKRDEFLVRAGIVARIVLNRSLEVRGSFVPTIHSRDHIGLLNSDFTELGVRYRWASE